VGKHGGAVFMQTSRYLRKAIARKPSLIWQGGISAAVENEFQQKPHNIIPGFRIYS